MRYIHKNPLYNPLRNQRRPLRPPKETPCGYCFENWATGYDHLVPVSQGGQNNEENLYPSCLRCNRIASNKLFATIEEKREYVQTKLRGKEMRKLREEIPAYSVVAEVLQSTLPLDALGSSTS